MSFEVRPVTAAGTRVLELAEKHAAEFAATAEDYDRRSAFPFPHWKSMQRSGFLAASVPADLGGLGAATVTDLAPAVSMLARGDASIAIGAAMHLSAFWFFARLAAAPAPDLSSALVKLLLRRCARGRVVACVAISEPGTSLAWPRSTARADGEGYLIDGRKTFCTGSPVGSVFLTTVRMPGPAGEPQLGFAVIPRETAGLSVADNWDALGMRASGSNDVRFAGCRVPAAAVTVAGPLGALPTSMMPLPMVGAALLISASIGIAERAQELIAAPVAAADGAPAGGSANGSWTGQPAARGLLAENEIDLAAARAVLARVAAGLDAALAPDAPALDRAGLHELMKQVQCANVVAKRSAMAVVDRALTISGGRGYRSAHPLSRLYRDVRAGPFMQPFSFTHVMEYIGRVTLGWPTELDDQPEGEPDDRGSGGR